MSNNPRSKHLGSRLCSMLCAVSSTGRELVFVSEKYFRPAEVEELLGDSTKARTELGWRPHYDFADLVGEMVHSDCG